MDPEKFLEGKGWKHSLRDLLQWEHLVKDVTAAIAQDREEREVVAYYCPKCTERIEIAQDREEREKEPMFKDCGFDNHDNDSGIEIEFTPIPPDPLAAKLERLAEGADDNGCYVVMRMYRKKSTVNIHGKGPLSELMTGHGPDYHWAAVDAALEEVEGKEATE